MPSTTPTIVFNQAFFAWPDGTAVLDATTAVIGQGRTSLIGDNGTGKTTVLRLITGELTPTDGTVTTSGEVGYLPQNLTLVTDARVADLLGVRRPLDALRAIESRDVTPAHFDAVGNDWDIEARAEAALGLLGLAHLHLDRLVGSLSGGEAMLVALAGLRLFAKPITLLDEPTNNLDRGARERLYAAISGWQGALMVVSHDVELLDLMDDTAELYGRRLSLYGGGFSQYADAFAQEQAAAKQALRSAEQDLKREQRQRREAETKLARRRRYAKTAFLNKRLPKVVMNTRRFQAEESAGKLRGSLDQRVDEARADVAQQEGRIRVDARVRIDLPRLVVPAGRRLAELHHAGGVRTLAGPERVAIIGANGIGKTLLLETLFDRKLRARRCVFAKPLTDRIGYLPQRLDGLDDQASALDNVRAVARVTPPGLIRARLARFLLRGDDVDRPVATLSGGERSRVALARLLLADPPHQLLVLDEPTNNLDLTTAQALVDGLSGYHGALLVVSHDQHLLEQLGIGLLLTLDEAGTLTPNP